MEEEVTGHKLQVQSSEHARLKLVCNNFSLGGQKMMCVGYVGSVYVCEMHRNTHTYPHSTHTHTQPHTLWYTRSTAVEGKTTQMLTISQAFWPKLVHSPLRLGQNENLLKEVNRCVIIGVSHCLWHRPISCYLYSLCQSTVQIAYKWMMEVNHTLPATTLTLDAYHFASQYSLCKG